LIYHPTFKVILGDEMIGYAIGDSDMITGFRLVGVEGMEVSDEKEAIDALHKTLARNDVGVIIISQSFSAISSMRAEIDKIRQERITPLIVELPGSKGTENKTQLSDVVSKILGIKI
jgi:vacuolar-type H+-ATPase subunit F/Vma7